MAIGGHHNPTPKTETWLTPLYIIEALGAFDLDPCAPLERPEWIGARKVYTIMNDGLAQPWEGRVWLNPPYGNKVGYWMKRMAAHNQGTALIFARTETDMFFETVWAVASAVFFFRGRINFCFPHGRQSPANAGAPSVLVAYGADDSLQLEHAAVTGKLKGQYVSLR